jgi:hypothetical protein
MDFPIFEVFFGMYQMYNIISVREKHMSCECHYYAFNVIDLGSNPTRKNKPFQVKQVQLPWTTIMRLWCYRLGFNSNHQKNTFSIATSAMTLDMHWRLHDFLFCWKFGYNKGLTIFREFKFFYERKSIAPKLYRYYANAINSQHVQHPMSEFQSFHAALGCSNWLVICEDGAYGQTLINEK